MNQERRICSVSSVLCDEDSDFQKEMTGKEAGHTDQHPPHIQNPDALEVAPGVEHKNLEGWIPSVGNDEDLRQALEKAFDYRGDITITASSDDRMHIKAHQVVHTSSDKDASRIFDEVKRALRDIETGRLPIA